MEMSQTQIAALQALERTIKLYNSKDFKLIAAIIEATPNWEANVNEINEAWCKANGKTATHANMSTKIGRLCEARLLKEGRISGRHRYYVINHKTLNELEILANYHSNYMVHDVLVEL